LPRRGHLKFFKMAASHHLGVDANGNSAVRSANLENATLEPNMKWIRWPVAELWPFIILQKCEVGRSLLSHSLVVS